MKNCIALAVAMVATAIISAPEANAQFNNGFQFGSGIAASGGSFGSFGFNAGGTRPPYFAQFPPVYYNGIVRRPYGISPYAAPAGVVPVELNYRPEGVAEPIVISNPHFSGGISKPASAMEKKLPTADTETDNKSAKVVNPYLKSDAKTVSLSLQAASSVLEPSVESLPETKADVETEAKPETKSVTITNPKSVTITNPFFKRKMDSSSLSPMMQVSYSVLER